MTEMVVESQSQPIADVRATTNVEAETMVEKNEILKAEIMVVNNENVKKNTDVELEINLKKENHTNITKETEMGNEINVVNQNQICLALEDKSTSKCELLFGNEITNGKETKSHIHNPKSTGANYCSNTVNPFKGFCDDEYNSLLAKIDDTSNRLFNIVTKADALQKAAVYAVILRNNGTIPIKSSPRAYLVNVEIKKVADKQREEEKENNKLKMLRDLLDAGWKRVLMKSSTQEDNAKISYVYYFSPEGKKFKFPKEVVKYLSRKPGIPWTLDHFCFFKKPIYPESLRESYQTACPRNASVVIENTGKESCSEEEVETVRKEFEKRRNVQPPKRYSGKGDEVGPLPKRKAHGDENPKSRKEGKVYLEMGMLPPKFPMKSVNSLASYGTVKEEPCDSPMTSNEDGDDSMFLISAMQESGEYHQLEQQLELEKQMKQLQETQDVEVEGIPTIENQNEISGTGNVTKKKILKQCSISCCQGTIKRIPGLQCQVCLCMYHPECLGLSMNVISFNYSCLNCKGTQVQFQPEVAQKKKRVIRPPPALAAMPDFLKPPKSYAVAADAKRHLMKGRNSINGSFSNWSQELQKNGKLPPKLTHDYSPIGSKSKLDLPMESLSYSETLWFEPPTLGIFSVRSRVSQYPTSSPASNLINVGIKELIKLLSSKETTVRPTTSFPKNVVLPPIPELKPISMIKPFRSEPFPASPHIHNHWPRTNTRASNERLQMRNSIPSFLCKQEKPKAFRLKPFPYIRNVGSTNCMKKVVPTFSNGHSLKQFPQRVISVNGKKFFLMPGSPESPEVAMNKDELTIQEVAVV